jgi:hypothetical protein
VGVPNNKIDNQTLSGSFLIISNSSVFTDIRNEFAYASRFRKDMRPLFIELHVLHRSYKSLERLRVKEQKKKEAASSTNIEDDISMIVETTKSVQKLMLSPMLTPIQMKKKEFSRQH